VTTDPYIQQIRVTWGKLLDLMARRKEIEAEISKQRQLITANANMLPDAQRDAILFQVETAVMGRFTDMIRFFYQTHRNLTPRQVKELLERSGYDLSDQVNPMASIHAVIRRLVDNRELAPYGDVAIGGYHYVAAKPQQAVWNAVEKALGRTDLDDPDNPLYTSGMRPFPKKGLPPPPKTK